jgi:hypothetical protein
MPNVIDMGDYNQIINDGGDFTMCVYYPDLTIKEFFTTNAEIVSTKYDVLVGVSENEVRNQIQDLGLDPSDWNDKNEDGKLYPI